MWTPSTAAAYIVSVLQIFVRHVVFSQTFGNGFVFSVEEQHLKLCSDWNLLSTLGFLNSWEWAENDYTS